jgi:DNA repair photolyase
MANVSLRNNDVNVCKECEAAGLGCGDRQKCAPVRKAEFRGYNGVRLTADGFDCALPVTIDSHSSCAYECLYCFSDNIIGHSNHNIQLGRTSLAMVEGIFSGREGQAADKFRKALRYDKRNADGWACPVQLGGLCDPCDSIEQNSGWLLEFMRMVTKYKQPVRMSTKGAIFQIPEYFQAITRRPEQFWVAFSIMCNDDHLIEQVDRLTPNTTLRLATMKKLSAAGVSTSLRLRPVIQGITDYKRGHIDLIKRAADAGAKAISYEVMFYPMTVPKANKWKYARLNTLAGVDLAAQYKKFGRSMACMRPSYKYTEDIMHEIAEVAHSVGLTVGVSDPVWKQLSDVGCCCGITPTDKVFGNWEPENMTNAIVVARDGKDKRIHLRDIVPPWALDTRMIDLCAGKVGPTAVYQNRHKTWADNLRVIWNNPSKQRSPMNYLQGAVQIDGEDAQGNYVYRYEGLKRKDAQQPPTKPKTKPKP